MSDDRTPQRPEGVPAPAPRVEVEPTPQPGTTAPGSTPYQQRYGAQAQAGSQAQPGAQATDKIPFVSSTATPAGATETVKHTVVKTKTKKFPVFIASLAGLAVGAVLVIALVMSGAFRITDSNVEPTTTGSASSGTQNIKIDAEDSTLAEAVSAKALPSVVSITAMTSGNGTTTQGSDSSGSSGSIGSGVILDKDGNILTNYHVIEGATSIAVSTDDGTSYEAEIVGQDESSDLAVVKIKDTKGATLTPIEIGDSSSLKVGAWVMAIGSPFGNEQSVSTGIVSALYRSTALPSTSGTSIYANMIQTDAAINPGNSGGALVDSEGKLVGINSVIESYSGSSSGVGFAIPINYAKKIADQIIAGKTPVHPYLGVTLTSVNALSANSNTTEGAQVVKVESGGPADKAGIKTGDVITKADDESVTSADGLIIALREHEVGDKVKLTLTRDGKEQTVEVTLGSDEALQNSNDSGSNSQGQDSTEGNSNGSGMTEEQFLQYLEELMGRGGNSGNSGNSGNGFGY